MLGLKNEDLDIFFNEDDFATTVGYYVVNDDSELEFVDNIKVIYTEPTIIDDGNAPIKRSTINLLTALAYDFKTGEIIEHEDAYYMILRVVEDGTGLVTLNITSDYIQTWEDE